MTLSELQNKYALSDRHACELVFSFPHLGMSKAKMTYLRDKLMESGFTKEQAKERIFSGIDLKDSEELRRVIEIVKTFC